MIGQTISHYKILEKLGEGGMGVVYKAHDIELDRDVALKFLPRYLTSDAAEKERFYHEARAASALNHPNITTIYEIGQADDQLFIAMEYVEGKTLKKLVEHDTLSIHRVLEIAIQICEGLVAAAEKAVVHRDIKSDNLMLTAKGQVKIMDFGLAKLKGSTKLTKAGSTLGTAAYMSPEQAQGAEVDHRSDIFSFGVVLYELLTGKVPFRGEHQAALMYSLINEDPPPLARFNDKVTPELQHIVSKTLAKDREERYQHIDDLLADLRRERKRLEYAKSGYVKTSMMPPMTKEVPPGKRLLRYVVPSVALLVLSLVLLMFNPFNFEINMQKGVASGKNSLAVVYFENLSDPEDKDQTGEMLTNLLITSLFQARDLDVISRERLYEIQKELGQGDAKTIPPSMATKVAQRAGVSMMLLGSILQKQPTMTVTYRLLQVGSGKILSSQRLSGFSNDRIFSLVDTLALLVRNDLRITPSSPAEIKSVAEVTTTSPEAYRSYVEGLEQYRKFYDRESRAALERAVELDKEFAMAYFFLSFPQGRLGDVQASRVSLQKAVELSDRVTERERLQILARSYQQRNDLTKALETLEKLAERYPREIGAYLLQNLVYRSLLQPERQAEILRRALNVDPSYKDLWNELAYTSADLNRRQDAFDALNEYLKLAPGEPNPYDSRGDIHAMFGEYDSSRVWYQKASEFRRSFISTTKLGFDAILRRDYKGAEEYFLMSEFQFPDIEIWRGQLKAAQTKLTNIPSAISFSGRPFEGLREHIHVAYEAIEYPEMLRLARKLCVELKKNPQDKIYGRDYLAWALVKNGSVAQAEKTLGEIQSDLDAKLAIPQVAFDYASGVVAFEENKYREAAGHFRKAFTRIAPNQDPNLLFAASLLKNGETAQALTLLERLAHWYPTIGGRLTLPTNPGSVWYWPISSVKAHYWLGVAYQQQGDKQKAIKEYETFLDIWKEADFKSKEIEDAKAQVANLKGVTAK